MSAHHPLFHDLFERLSATVPQFRKTARTRLALLVTGILLAQSCVEARIAQELLAVGITRAHSAESIGRRLRRILNDPRLDPRTCYEPALASLIDWESLRRSGRPITLIVDESGHTAVIHLLRLSLAYRGTAVPLVWAVWEQNVAQGAGAYWQVMDEVLARVAALLPPDQEVVVTADRAYDVPPFIDRLTARGWHWVIRLKAKGSARFLDAQGQEQPIRLLLRRKLPQRGRRCKFRGKLFKDAGWRDASVVAAWGTGHDEALVVITDLPPQWAVLPIYRRRFWTELGFRSDKRAGWQWESCQVREVAHHQVLLLALAWATLVSLCLGAAAAEEAIKARQQRPARRPEHARASLFTLGRYVLQRLRYRPDQWTLRWLLPDPAAPAWNDQWLALQRQQCLRQQTVRP